MLMDISVWDRIFKISLRIIPIIRLVVIRSQNGEVFCCLYTNKRPRGVRNQSLCSGCGVKNSVVHTFRIGFFGMTWAIKEVDELLGGLFFGFVSGAAVQLIVSFAEQNLATADFAGADLLYITCKWIIPTIIYSTGASFPWKD